MHQQFYSVLLQNNTLKTFRLLSCIALATLLLTSCKKYTSSYTPIIEYEEVYPDDTQMPRLKTLVAQGLPSPYFSFQYNDSGYVTAASFSSGFHEYLLEYQNSRLYKMVNTKSGDTLFYQYTAGRVTAVMQYTELNTKTASYKMQYDQYGRLESMFWFDFNTANPLDSVATRKVLLQYHMDGNLAKKDEYYAGASGALEWTGSEEYQDYGAERNVDGFTLLKDSFDEFVFLPQVKLQRNNPGLVVSKGVHNDSKIDYQYSSVNGLPIEKKGRMEFTRGADAGKVFNFVNRFEY